MTIEVETYDVIVVGAGVAGCCTARELSRFNLKCLVLEGSSDIASGASRANSGIVHAGYDPLPNTLKAHYNVLGSKLYPTWAQELQFAYKQNGSLVLAFDSDEMVQLEELVQRASQNGVENVHLIDSEELACREPNVSPDAIGALYAPTGAIVDPYGICQGAAENALSNGVEFLFEHRVEEISRADSRYIITCSNGSSFGARCVVNASGAHADDFHNMVSDHSIHITPRRGDYCLFDAGYGNLFESTIFQAPSSAGKGVLVVPVVHGNLIIGPSSSVQESKDDVSTDVDDLTFILENARKTWPQLDERAIITNFAGVRATGNTRDFVIGQPDDAPGFFDIACFDSPGLTAAPAVAQDIARDCAAYVGASDNPSFNPIRTCQTLFAMVSWDTQAADALIASNPLHGNVVCRCCSVTEADIVQALHAPLPVLTLDTLKWRVGAMMGRCHAGFCSPEILKLFVRETGREPRDVLKRLPGSNFIDSARSDYKDLVSSDDSLPSRDFDDAEFFDVVVIGAGVAGIAAATSARKNGAQRVALVERANHLGGILNQCIHNGFGLHRYNEELTGPEYASREVAEIEGLDIEIYLNTTVLRCVPREDGRHDVVCASEQGSHVLTSASVVLSTGSRERGLGALNIAGSRPSGVFSAGSAQNLMNLQGCLPGRNVVVLGSGDIGLIMARRLTLQGAHVVGVFEIKREPSGLKRNIQQCLNDFDIPLHLNTTVVSLEGEGRLSAVITQQVDSDTGAPLEGTCERVPCDTLLLSVGLIPENEVAKSAGVKLDPLTGGVVVDDRLQTSVPGIFACGNATQIHDLADGASREGDRAGAAAAGKNLPSSKEALVAEKLNEALDEPCGNTMHFTCTSCPLGCNLEVTVDDTGEFCSVEGNKCERGRAYAFLEVTRPRRMVTYALCVPGCLEPLSVKTDGPVPFDLMDDIVQVLEEMSLSAPIHAGQVVVDDICDTGVAVIATKTIGL